MGNGAQMNFDYVCMLLVASCIAVAGLATDSSVVVIASMLVSPLMGPVLAFTFGSTIKNKPMLWMGFSNECKSLLICSVAGFVIGFFWALCTQNRDDWPTGQMTERGQVDALFSGAFIAAASGFGVALSQ